MTQRAEPTTRFATLLSQLAPACLLIALAVVPLFANPETARIHDPERMIMLRVFGLLALALVTATGRIRIPIVATAGLALYATASLFSSFYSVAPTHALAGDYGRQFGVLTDFALIGVLLAASRITVDRTELAIRTMIASGSVAALVAVCEWFLSRGRVDGLAGGATFLADQIAPLLPLAIALRRTRTDAVAIGVLAVGLLAAGTRVSIVAVLIALALQSLLAGSVIGRRTLLASFGVLGTLLLLALPPLRSSLPEQSLPARIAALFDSRDVAQRTLLWRDALNAMRANPSGLLTGNGPDATGVLFTEHVSPELQRQLGGRARVDRFHCDPLDVLYTRGILGLLGMALLIGGALIAARGLAARGDRIALALFGLVVVATFDSFFAVPGATSRLLVFAAIGLLAARQHVDPIGTATEREERNPKRTKVAALVTVTPFLPAPILAALAVTLVFALGQPPWYAFFALLLPLRGARLLVGTYAALASLIVVIGGTGESAIAGDEVLKRSLLVALFDLVALALVVRTAFDPSTQQPVVTTQPGKARLAAGLVAAVLLALAWRDEVKRQFADVRAAVAATMWRDRERPDLAADLFADASALAPEVNRYRIRMAQALVDLAERNPDADPTELWLRAAKALELVSRIAEHDAFALSESADVLLRFAALLGAERPLAVAHASRLSDAALPRAAASVPVLQIAARVDLERLKPYEARERLELARSIDQADPVTSLLLGRTMARLNEVAGAAQYYAESLSGPLGRAEALTGIALAAASQGNIEEGAQILAKVVDLVPSLGNVRREIEGARPLLRYFGYDTAVATFVRLQELRPENDAGVTAVVTALRY